MSVVIIDYGMGNLASVQRAVSELGKNSRIINEPGELVGADKIILPGVGSFRQAMENLQDSGWVQALRDEVLLRCKPILGICLGMQLLADEGTEHGESSGLGLIHGKVIKFDFSDCSQFRIPHVGWNEISIVKPDPIVGGIESKTDFYFVHSYYFKTMDNDDIVAETPYGKGFPSIVRHGNAWGTQFHPEKSGPAGLKILANFLDYYKC